MAKVRVTDNTAMNAWLTLSDAEQLAAVASYLGPQARARYVAHGRNKSHRYSLDELAQLRAAQPAYPTGEPSDQWSPEELRAYLAVKDAEIAAQPKPKRQIRIDQLDDQQLHQVAQATTQEQVDRLLDAFTQEQLGETVDDLTALQQT